MQYNYLVEKIQNPTPRGRTRPLEHVASRVSPRGPGRREIAKAQKRARILAAALLAHRPDPHEFAARFTRLR